METSQRIVDVLLGALAQACPDRIPAASQGTMNNVSIGGWDPERNRFFTYYETIGGGMGASPISDGVISDTQSYDQYPEHSNRSIGVYLSHCR